MPGDTAELLQTADAALAADDWPAARTAYEAVLEREPVAEAFLGLGSALWWLGETGAAVQAQQRAYAEFCRRPDPVQAAGAALGLCLLYRASLGNYAASRGWLQRLARIVEDHGLLPLNGWVALCRAVTANDSNDPSSAEPWAHEALEAAGRLGDADLQLCALTELGTALSQRGKVEDGAALLDEAMAGATSGEGLRPETVVFISCRSIICYCHAAQVDRAAQWIRASDPIARRYGGLHLYTVCRVNAASILFAGGRWSDAERELHAALQVGRNAERPLYGEALAGLATLRLAQGRDSEAIGLLAGFEDHFAAAAVLGAFHLGRGEPALAEAILQRRLADIGELCLDAAPVVELLVEAEIELGQLDAAAIRASELAELGDAAGCSLITGRGHRALGRALTAAGDTAGAAEHLQRALREFVRLDLPLEAGRTHLLLARVLGADAPEVAVAEARAALEVFERLGAGADADIAAAYLRSLGVTATRHPGPRSLDGLTQREREVLGLLAEGLSNRELADRLFLTRKTIEHHVRNVLTKLGLRNRAEAAAYAVRHLGR